MTWRSVFAAYKAGMRFFGECVSVVVSSVVLTVVYCVGVGVTALFARIARKAFLDTRIGGHSYWNAIKRKKQNKEACYRQF